VIVVIRKFLILLLALNLIFVISFGTRIPSVKAAGATITGRVVDQNGNGIDGVQVLSHNGEPTGYRTANSSGGGYYQLTDVAIGSSHLQANLIGSNLALAHYWNFEVAAGGSYNNVNFTLRPGGGGISGRVLDGSGIGVSEASIVIFEETGQGFNNGCFAMTKTDAQGYFASSLTNAPGPGIAGGTYTVKASKTGLPDVTKDNIVVNTGSVTSNVNLSIVSGTGIIAGQITEVSSGGAIPDANVLADNGVIQVSAKTDINGFYQLYNLPTGAYNVVISKSGYANAHQYSVNAVSGSVTNDVNFRLTTQIGQIRGRVLNQNGQPILGAMIIADSDQGTGFSNTSTDSTGTYLLSNLAPMKYYVHATAPGLSGLIIKADVFAGQTTEGVNFVLGEVDGGISGNVTKDGQAAPYANIFVNSSSGGDEMFYRDAIADANGFYKIENLPPGEYDVHVYGVPGYTNQVWFHIIVGSDLVRGINFNLINGTGQVEGRVTDTFGQPVMGATVQLFQLSNLGTWAAAITDSNGYYSAKGLWSGDYNIYADYNEYPTVMRSYIPVSDSGLSKVDIVLGLDRSLLANPRDISITVEQDAGTYKGVLVDVTSGEATVWTAQSSVEWLLLGNSGDIFEDSGQTGLDGLVLRFDPSKVEYGTYTTDVVITAPDAQPSSIRVTMSKVDPASIKRVFIPMVGAGK